MKKLGFNTKILNAQYSKDDVPGALQIHIYDLENN
jgi:hypothetical protein